jgi:hypothetical protein
MNQSTVSGARQLPDSLQRVFSIAGSVGFIPGAVKVRDNAPHIALQQLTASTSGPMTRKVRQCCSRGSIDETFAETITGPARH